MELTATNVFFLLLLLYILWCTYRLFRANKFTKKIPENANLSKDDQSKNPIGIMLSMICGFKPFKLESWFDEKSIANIREAQRDEDEFRE
jgi:hypothetical protein